MVVVLEWVFFWIVIYLAHVVLVEEVIALSVWMALAVRIISCYPLLHHLDFDIWMLFQVAIGVLCDVVFWWSWEAAIGM